MESTAVNRPALSSVEAKNDDLDGLSWCADELRKSFEAIEGFLERYRASSEDLSLLSAAREHVHQAYGVLCVIEIAGPAQVCAEIEGLLDRVLTGDLRLEAGMSSAISAALSAITEYLDERLRGHAARPLRLFPYLRDLLAQRQAERIHPADLFFPNQGRLAIAGESLGELSDADRKAIRARFEQALLRLLRSPKESAAARDLLLPIDRIARSSLAAEQQTFWVLTAIYFRSLADGHGELDVYGKRLLARLNLQLRRTLSDGTPVSDRLQRDLLFSIACQHPGSPELQRVFEIFGLHDLVPEQLEQARYGQIDRRALRALAEAVVALKKSWEAMLQNPGGLDSHFGEFKQALAQYQQEADDFDPDGLGRLSGAWISVVKALTLDAGPVTEALGVEMATSLLFVEQLLESGFSDFDHREARCAEISRRLDACLHGIGADEEAPAWLLELSASVQERKTLQAFVAETRLNLSEAETALDAWFRNPAEGLDALSPAVVQVDAVAGAMALLAYDHAASAAVAISKAMRTIIGKKSLDEQDGLTLAENVGNLGFFIDAMTSANGLLDRFEFDSEKGVFQKIGQLGDAAIDADTALAVKEPSVSLEKRLQSELEAFDDMLVALSEGNEALEHVLAQLAKILDTAQLADSADFADSVQVAQLVLEENGASAAAQVAKLLDRRIEAFEMQAEPEQAPLPEAAEQIDAELLEVFLAEAQEVLGEIFVAYGKLHARPSDSDQLTAARRGFHTLKGSSRMVGLDAFGEAAWSIEQLLNHCLGEDRGADEALLALIERAHSDLAEWVEALVHSGPGGALRDASHLIACADAMRLGKPVPTRTDDSPAPESGGAVFTSIPSDAQAQSAEILQGGVPEVISDEEHAHDVVAPAPAQVPQPSADPGGRISEPPSESPEGSESVSLGDSVAETFSDSPDHQSDAEAISPVLSLDALTDDGSELGVPEALESIASAPDAGSIVETEEVAGDSRAMDVDAFSLSLDFPDEPGDVDDAPPSGLIGQALQLDSEQNTAASGEAEVLLPSLDLSADFEPSSAVDSDPQTVENTFTLDLTDSAADGVEDEPPSLPLDTVDSPVDATLCDIDDNAAIVDTADRSEGIAFDDGFDAGDKAASESSVSSPGPFVQDDSVAEMAIGSGAAPEPADAVPADRELSMSIDSAAVQIEDDGFSAAEHGDGSNVLPASAPGVPDDASHDDIQDDEIVTPDGRRVSRSLFQVFAAEIDELQGPLLQDARDWQQHPQRCASELALRGVHSLKGSAALVGAEPQRMLAAALEDGLQVQLASGRAANAADLANYGVLLQALMASLKQYARHEPVQSIDQAIEQAQALVQKWRGQRSDPAQTNGQPAVGIVKPATDEAPELCDEIDPELLPLFVEEASEYLPQIDGNLRDWLARPDDKELQRLIMRQLHTVKGSARMAGAMVLGQRVHEMETQVEAAMDVPSIDVAMIESLLNEHDAVTDQFERMLGMGGSEPSAAAVAEAPQYAGEQEPGSVQASSPGPESSTGIEDSASVREDVSALAPVMGPVAEPSVVPAPVDAKADAPAGTVPAPSRALEPISEATRPAAQPLVRVRAELLDTLVNESGEASIARSRLDSAISGARGAMSELAENVNRLRQQLREIEMHAETRIQANRAPTSDSEAREGFDPLEFDRFTRFQELARMLAESVNDVATVQQNTARNLDEAASDLNRQGMTLRQLQHDLLSVRMVQFGTINDRLYRVVRQSAKALGKRVSLDVRGATVHTDRGVLERMVPPLEHLLRNAIAHGIEKPADRIAAGKGETGEIIISVQQNGNEVVISLSDDGGGLNLARIRERGLDRGLIRPDTQISDETLADLIFRPGFSTADEVDQISGRGVGMDVVRSEVSSLGGRIEVVTDAGQGSRFDMHLPITMALAQVVAVAVGEMRYAVSAASVESLMQLSPNELAQAYANRSIEVEGKAVPLYYLATLVDEPNLKPSAQHASPIMLVRTGTGRIAVHADSVSKAHEVVVKSVGPQVARIGGVGGATVLGNGEILLILNLGQLAREVNDSVQDAAMRAGMEARLADAPATIMVVDDSVTVRKVTQRLLHRLGYDTVLAKDGVDALRQLHERVPDAMLLDIEMPRMDGFDLTRALRKDDRFAKLPIIMITSRTADKHRNHAMSLGVNAFLGKPFVEAELTGLLAQYTAR